MSDWMEYNAAELGQHVAVIVADMLRERDARIIELEKLVDQLERELDEADSKVVAHA